jgi:hypothetical protein
VWRAPPSSSSARRQPSASGTLSRIGILINGLVALSGFCGVSRPFPSWNRSILTEIYPCHARSCHTKCEISKLRVETPGQAEAEAACRAAGYSGLLQRALDVKLRLPRQQPPVPDTPPRTTVHMTGLGDHTSASPPLPSRRRRIGVSRRLRVRLSVAEERVIADRRQTTQTSMIASETMRAAR